MLDNKAGLSIFNERNAIQQRWQCVSRKLLQGKMQIYCINVIHLLNRI